MTVKKSPGSVNANEETLQTTRSTISSSSSYFNAYFMTLNKRDEGALFSTADY